MKSEIFVVNAIKSSERAFSAVAEHISSSDLESLLKVLQNSDKVAREARQLNLPRDQLFVFLENAIHEAFDRPAFFRLTRDHLKALMDVEVQRCISQVLNCSVQEVLQEIFSIPDLQETLDYLGGDARSMPANAKLLLNEILRPDRAQQLEIDYTTTSNNWEPIVKNEGWLRETLAQRFVDSKAAPEMENTIQRLAELIEKCTETIELDSDHGPRQSDQIDVLGLLEIRRRISWIVSRLYDQAIEISENIARGQLDSPMMRLLVSLIYIYQLGSTAKGVEYFITTSYKLRDILPLNNTFGFPLDEEKIANTKSMLYSEEKAYMLDGAPVGNFEIKCTVNNAEQTLLKVIGAPSWICQQLKRDIPSLSPKDLNQQGQHLWERLLNTAFPIEPAQITRLKEAVGKLGPVFVQAVVLSSDGIIQALPNSWGEPIDGKLLWDELPVRNDPVYNASLDDLISNQKTQFGYRNSAVRRGMQAGVDDR